MAATASPSAPKKAKRTTRPRRKKAAPASRGLSAADVTADIPSQGLELAEQIRSDGGTPLSTYREPLGGHPVVLASLPIDKVEPTPYQRDLSEPHVKRLANAMERVDRYLDPMIAVRHDGKYWTPNGNHRLGASRLVGARAGNELEFAALFEEPAFITLGAAYEKRPRFSGGAYHPIVKRLEQFLDLTLEKGLAIREERAAKLLELDDAVIEIVNRLKAKGLVSPYLKNFVVARINFLRFKREGTAEFDPTIAKMLQMGRKFNVDNVNKEDVARMGGAPAEPESDE